MVLVRTIIFIPAGLLSPVEVRVYTDYHLTGKQTEGFWIIESNQVVLSPLMYSQFAALSNDQNKRGKFLSNLRRISIADLKVLIG